MKLLVRSFGTWAPLGMVITGMCLLVFAAVQHNYRNSLNDPQIQIAEDAAHVLAGGGVPAELVERGQRLVDIEKSLAPFIGVYDEAGTPLESSGVFEGAPPRPPQGVFEYARMHGDNLPHDTWEPKTGVRMATEVLWVPETKQFIAVGRNMRMVEYRIQQLALFVLIAWIVMIGATFVTTVFFKYFD